MLPGQINFDFVEEVMAEGEELLAEDQLDQLEDELTHDDEDDSIDLDELDESEWDELLDDIE